MKSITEHKEDLLIELSNLLIKAPNIIELRDEHYKSILLKSVDKTILWFLENYGNTQKK